MKTKLYIAMLDNGIDGERPYTILANSYPAACRIANANKWAFVRGVTEEYLITDDAGMTYVSQKLTLVNLPNANMNRASNKCATPYGYCTSEIEKAVGVIA